ncbi:hypothetical protein AB3H13_27285 [Escherichia coli]
MITSLILLNQMNLYACAAGMPLCGGTLTGVYICGFARISLSIHWLTHFRSDMEAVAAACSVWMISTGTAHSAIWGMKAFLLMKKPERALKMRT